MAGDIQNAMACADFEAVLSEALDQNLGQSMLQSFQAHAVGCASCGALLQEAEAGRSWLKSLQEAEPPSNLVSNILVATSGLRVDRSGAVMASKGSWEQFMAVVVAPV